MTYTEERDAAAKSYSDVAYADLNIKAAVRLSFVYGADWQRARAKKLVEALMRIKKSTEEDPAEGPELRARAAVVYKVSSEALKEYGDDDAKYPLTTKEKT